MALAIGNVWLVIHRYIIQQGIDYLFWRKELPAAPPRSPGGDYSSDIAEHTWNHFLPRLSSEKFIDHLRYRRASNVLLYIVAEVFLIFPLFAEEPGIISKYWIAIMGIGAFIFLAAVYQNYITMSFEQKLSKAGKVDSTPVPQLPLKSESVVGKGE